MTIVMSAGIGSTFSPNGVVHALVLRSGHRSACLAPQPGPRDHGEIAPPAALDPLPFAGEGGAVGGVHRIRSC